MGRGRNRYTGWTFIPGGRVILRTAIIAIGCAALQGQAPLRVGESVPGNLDLRDAAAADWVPGDSRDPAQVQAKIEAWSARVAPLLGRPAIRILLPRGPGRVPLLLAAKKQVPASAGTLPTHSPLFVGWLVGVILLVGALSFLPSLALGPVVQEL
ncbi:MAG: potassium-transporting ATPase subunit KdpA, partial [Holophaga sp.]|nr:potassium-transporting ATPase subunit KdpA [Holophaga sp.]